MKKNKIAHILHRKSFMHLHNKKNTGESAGTRQIFQIEKNKESDSKDKIIEKYSIDVDGAKADIEIKRESMLVTYNLILPEINPATSVLMHEIRNELISITTVSMKELTDPSLFSSIKNKFIDTNGYGNR